jgi:hypothetical protein
MGFLNALGKITKSAIDVAVTPVEVAKDVVTLAGALTDEDESYTVRRLRKAKENAEGAYDELGED